MKLEFSLSSPLIDNGLDDDHIRLQFRDKTAIYYLSYTTPVVPSPSSSVPPNSSNPNTPSKETEMDYEDPEEETTVSEAMSSDIAKNTSAAFQLIAIGSAVTAVNYPLCS